MLEKRFYAVPAQLFTADGTANGVIAIAGNACNLFKVKQHVIISASTLPNLTLEIKEIDGEHNIQVGPINGSITARTDISAYTVARSASISANQQKRPAIDYAEIQRAIYEEEPTVAQRTILVDECGNKINNDNPLPIAFDGTVNIGDVHVEGTNGNTIEPNSDGSLNVNIVNTTDKAGLVLTYNEITSVASGTEINIINFTAPPSSHYRISKIDVSGSNIAQFRVRLNGVVISTIRTYFSGPLSDSFKYEPYENGLKLSPGDVIRVTVIHGRPDPGDFEATMMASQV